MPEIPIPGVPTTVEDLDQLMASVDRALAADQVVRAAQLDPSEYDEAGVANAKARHLQAMAALAVAYEHVEERQHWRRELADGGDR